jgi:hypothetical protein
MYLNIYLVYLSVSVIYISLQSDKQSIIPYYSYIIPFHHLFIITNQTYLSFWHYLHAGSQFLQTSLKNNLTHIHIFRRFVLEIVYLFISLWRRMFLCPLQVIVVIHYDSLSCIFPLIVYVFRNCLFCLFCFLLGFTSHRYNVGHLATFQLLLMEEDLRCPSVHFFQARTGTWVEPPTFRKLDG